MQGKTRDKQLKAIVLFQSLFSSVDGQLANIERPAVHRAQGKGCAPGILGVCIGGDRASGYLLAKEQLFRKLDDVNPNPELAAFEKQLVDEANTLGIGPMGLGGATTLLGVKIGCAGRHPASYFVTISYSCWATRRYSIQIDKKGDIERWL